MSGIITATVVVAAVGLFIGLFLGVAAIKFKVEGLGPKSIIGIVDREENKMIKYGAENIPINANAWIQLKQIEETDTRLRITVEVDVPAIFRMMLDKKMQTSLDQAVDMLCQIKY